MEISGNLTTNKEKLREIATVELDFKEMITNTWVGSNFWNNLQIKTN